EDGIRDFHVTGVQTCALPIWRLMCVELRGTGVPVSEALDNVFAGLLVLEAKGTKASRVALPLLGAGSQKLAPEGLARELVPRARSEERRVGKGGRPRSGAGQ